MNRTQKKAVRERMVDFVRGRLDPTDALEVLDAVEQDPGLSRELDVHVELQNLARSGAASEFLEVPLVTEGHGPVVSESWWGWVPRGRRLLVPVGVLLGVVVVGVISMIILSKSSNPYMGLAELGDIGASFRMRGGSDAELVDASTRLMEGDAREAANRFERFLRMYPSSEWVPWVEYAAGLSRLANARTAVLGFGTGYDPAEVKRGMEHLDRVLQGSAVRELTEDALWYSAKGSLMLGDASGAEICLNRILSMQGSRQAAARELLSDLHSLH